MAVEDVDTALRRRQTEREAMPEPQRRVATGLSAAVLHAGQYIIYPYLRGSFYPPDTLYAVYSAMGHDRSLRRVLYSEPYLDLEGFCAYFSQTELYLAVTPDNEHVLGAVWFTGITEHKANVGIWAVKAMRGRQAQQMVARVCEFCFVFHRWHTIWGQTPWKSALYLGLRIGFQHVATVPGAIETARGKTLPLYVLRRDNPMLGYDDKRLKAE